MFCTEGNIEKPTERGCLELASCTSKAAFLGTISAPLATVFQALLEITV